MTISNFDIIGNGVGAAPGDLHVIAVIGGAREFAARIALLDAQENVSHGVDREAHAARLQHEDRPIVGRPLDHDLFRPVHRPILHVQWRFDVPEPAEA